MKIKKLKHYILIFAFALIGIFTLSSNKINAMRYNESTNSYVSSNLLDTGTLVLGSIETDGSFSSSTRRARTNIFEYNANNLGRTLYFDLFDTGSCNNFIGVRIGIHSYSLPGDSYQIEDSGWLNITGSNGITSYTLPSNTRYISILLSFSTTSSNVVSNSTEISTLNINEVRCIELSISSTIVDEYEIPNTTFYYGSIFSSCDVLIDDQVVYDCLPYVLYRQLGPTFNFEYLTSYLDYNSIIDSTNFSYSLTTYGYLSDVALYFEAKESIGVNISFYRDNQYLFTIDLEEIDYINIKDYTNTGFNRIVIYNANFDYSIKNMSFVNGYLIDSISNESYINGYDNGVKSSNTLVALVGAIFTGPVTMLSSIFDFEFLGINLVDLLFSLLTLLVVIWLIKKLV